jgi:extracellular matrix regulatory protein A
MKLLNVGFGNVVSANRVIAIVATDSAPVRRLKDEAKETGRLVDASQGRKTRAIVVMDSGHVVLSALQAETLAQRCASEEFSSDALMPHAAAARPLPRPRL